MHKKDQKRKLETCDIQRLAYSWSDVMVRTPPRSTVHVGQTQEAGCTAAADHLSSFVALQALALLCLLSRSLGWS